MVESHLIPFRLSPKPHRSTATVIGTTASPPCCRACSRDTIPRVQHTHPIHAVVSHDPSPPSQAESAPVSLPPTVSIQHPAIVLMQSTFSSVFRLDARLGMPKRLRMYRPPIPWESCRWPPLPLAQTNYPSWHC
ncbi:uncharacterized protein LY79DRAFT_287352 [Colletotrichum navitas]|uniref:Uncharacterized protein n=1 Tax=Colletotrichum navitas TaxID=681940 RepID=A0AAD8QCF3_9PEZI|nr:uncharacterized protein LY79DRAFT_287352 [Colletotrichum navitas]KAK1598379.1 hypothetical protein LY79DRAFT_287352 [Colletotrichum navitas]